MNDRNISYLLNKYQTKQPGEQWSTKTEVEYVTSYNNKQKIFQLEQIINERKTVSKGNFRFTNMQKARATYLIENLNFNLGGTATIEQFIVMIIVYIKLETNPTQKLKDFYPILNDYEIPLQTFVRFLIKLNKFHINRIPVT